MYIAHIEIANYKSYRATTAVDFQPGFNIITGKNNAGKTSLLEALSMNFSGLPHRSLMTVPAPNMSPPQESSVTAHVVLSHEEVLNLLQISGGIVYLPVPTPDFRLPDGSAVPANNVQRFIDWFFSRDEFNIRVSRSIAFGGNQEKWHTLEPTLGLYSPEPVRQAGRRNFLQLQIRENGKLAHIGGVNADDESGIVVRLAQLARPKIYRFFAERFSIGQSEIGTNPILTANASNLPEVLNILHGNPRRLQQLNQLLHEILPQVQQVSVHPIGGNTVEIKAWPHDPDTQREDLALPLSQCGSGIGQIAAILYVILTANQPQVILIDEPQSLLHPGAIRKLIEVLKQYPQHQYILATHSPAVITSANPSMVAFARLDGMERNFRRSTFGKHKICNSISGILELGYPTFLAQTTSFGLKAKQKNWRSHCS